MSLVIAAFNNEIGVLAHDGRAKNHNGEIIDEHYSKSFQVNENVVVGYAGDTYYCSLMIELLKDTVDLDSASVVDVYKAFRLPDKVIKDLKKNISMRFIILGKNRNNNVKCYAIDCIEGNYTMTPISRKDIDGINYVHAYNGSHGNYNDIIQKTLVDRIAKETNLDHALELGLCEVICKVAEFDDSVNTNVTTISLS